jgi:hypothetical protein
MNETLLHFIWKFRLFNLKELKTTAGESVEIIQTGTHNKDAGADFQNAKIRIGETLWAGNVEIHVQSSDWFTHGHQNNEGYNNVVLHVVYHSNGENAVRKSGDGIPTLELKERINANILYRYEELAKRKLWIPCVSFFNEVDEFTLQHFMERLSAERLENKVEQIEQLLTASDNDWENVMFQMLAKYLGAGVNQEIFQQLSKSLPVKIWAKHQHDALQIEALVFGQAGFLEEKSDDEYPNTLRKEYNYLKRLHGLQPLQKHQWKFLRLRPANFPTVRLAQLTALMSKEVKMFSAVIDTKKILDVHELLEANVSDYWKNHYSFDKRTNNARTQMGSSMKNILLINAVSPVLFAYGKYKGNEDFCERAIQLLEQSKPEANAVINGFKKMKLKPANALQTQSLLQLKNFYCDKFRCLDCAIGTKILK